MPWQSQRGKKYFYRSRRVGDQVLKEYLGSGPSAQAAAAEIEQVRQQRETDRAAADAMAAEMEPIDCLITKLEAGANLMADALLLCSGYHRHHQGDWRRKSARENQT